MTLTELKTEFINTIDKDKIDSVEDYEQYVEEIDESINLEQFLQVVGLWSVKASEFGAANHVLMSIIK